MKRQSAACGPTVCQSRSVLTNGSWWLWGRSKSRLLIRSELKPPARISTHTQKLPQRWKLANLLFVVQIGFAGSGDPSGMSLNLEAMPTPAQSRQLLRFALCTAAGKTPLASCDDPCVDKTSMMTGCKY